MAAELFYTRDGDINSGPVSSAQLKALARSGKLRPTDMVWREGMAKWTPGTKVKGLFNPVGQSVPAKKQPAQGSAKGRPRPIANKSRKSKPSDDDFDTSEKRGGRGKATTALLALAAVACVACVGLIGLGAVFTNSITPKTPDTTLAQRKDQEAEKKEPATEQAADKTPPTNKESPAQTKGSATEKKEPVPEILTADYMPLTPGTKLVYKTVDSEFMADKEPVRFLQEEFTTEGRIILTPLKESEGTLKPDPQEPSQTAEALLFRSTAETVETGVATRDSPIWWLPKLKCNAVPGDTWERTMPRISAYDAETTFRYVLVRFDQLATDGGSVPCVIIREEKVLKMPTNFSTYSDIDCVVYAKGIGKVRIDSYSPVAEKVGGGVKFSGVVLSYQRLLIDKKLGAAVEALKVPKPAPSRMTKNEPPPPGGGWDEREVCGFCKGTGVCSSCNGTGYWTSQKRRCAHCTNGRCSPCGGTGFRGPNAGYYGR
jgi:hypothetical protein